MSHGPDDLDKLLADVRKTITDNRQFMENLLVETDDNQNEELEEDTSITSEDFEEL